MPQLLTDPITGATQPRNIEAFLSGPVGAEASWFAARPSYRNSAWHLPGLGVFPEPSDNTVDDFGIQTGGGFRVDIVALEDASASVVAPADSANLYPDPTVPDTETIALVPGDYCVWFIGLGSITVAAGTATITGAGTATANGAGIQSSYVAFTVTVAGTVTFTVVQFYSDLTVDLTVHAEDTVGYYA